jgi:uncharacterized protein YyaL (SSP411 family)
MATNLYQLSVLFDVPEWKEKSEDMINTFSEATVKYPTSFGVWLLLLQQMIYGTAEIAITGEKADALSKEIIGFYIPYKLMMVSTTPKEEFPLLKDKWASEETLIYLCRNYACQQPVTTVTELKNLLLSK